MARREAAARSTRAGLCGPAARSEQPARGIQPAPDIMKICMMTNTYLPHVGGVARSVSTFAEEFIRQGHEVLVVAPEFPGRPLPAKAEAIVERVPALQNFNGSEFSVRLPLAASLSNRLEAFQA